jgi:AraC-like DNA-binding protein
MPVERALVAQQDRAAVERVVARTDGRGWGALHASPNWRCVLPGIGQVKWRNLDEFLFVDPLTAFRIDRGETYQLQHLQDRLHLVLCQNTEAPAWKRARAWRVPIGQVFSLMVAARRLSRGDGDVDALARTLEGALRHSTPIPYNDASVTVARAREFITQNAGSKLPVEAVSEETRCSPFQLQRLFRSHMHTSPHRYLVELRLACALHRMREGERDLSALAHELGFCTQSHFGDVFRRTVGCTPAAARSALA